MNNEFNGLCEWTRDVRSSTDLGTVFALDKVCPFLVPGCDDLPMPESSEESCMAPRLAVGAAPHGSTRASRRTL
jgi:hypothetical protein